MRKNAAFPGVPVTAQGVDENGDNWYKITLDRSVYTNVIFSGGSNTTQTADLGLGTGDHIIYYVNNHTGYDGNDIWPEPPVVVEPTCTEPGSITYIGMFTNVAHVTETGSALGHNPGEPVRENFTAPTATANGGYDAVTYCQRCSAELSREHTELLLDSNLALSIDLITTIELKAVITLRNKLVKDYASWYLEIVLYDIDGNVKQTKLYGEGQENPMEHPNDSLWKLNFKDLTARFMDTDLDLIIHCFDADGNHYVGATQHVNIRDSLVTLLTNDERPDAERTLAADILNYISETQLAFGTQGVDYYELANALEGDALDDLHAYQTDGEAPASQTITGLGSDKTFTAADVLLQNRPVLNLTTAKLQNVTGTVTVHVTGPDNYEKTLEATPVGTAGRYKAKFDDFNARQVRQAYTFTVQIDGADYGTPLVWSMEAFIATARTNPNFLYLNLCNAILKYIDSVFNYFG